jgi:pyrroloquinoline quinone biosynthesis protein D
VSPLDRRPRLAAKARLRADRLGGGVVLLAPERGLALNGTGAALLGLCDGRHTVRAIAAELRARCAAPTAADVEREVAEFLARLAARGLVVED